MTVVALSVALHPGPVRHRTLNVHTWRHLLDLLGAVVIAVLVQYDRTASSVLLLPGALGLLLVSKKNSLSTPR